jgi:hypothetical protein
MHRLIIFFLTIFLAAPGLAADIALTPYQASYALYRGGLNVASSELSLEQSGRYWRWRQTSKPKGIYALFSNINLYAETTLLRLDDEYKIHNILLSDEGDDQRYENARFNWSNQHIDIQYKNKRYLETIPGKIYDSHSIHLLTAHMLKQNIEETDFNYYRRGELAKSHLIRTGKSTLEIDRKMIEVMVFEQTTEGSRSKMKYFYDPEKPLLPIKIERTKPEKKTTIMLLRSVEWR